MEHHHWHKINTVVAVIGVLVGISGAIAAWLVVPAAWLGVRSVGVDIKPQPSPTSIQTPTDTVSPRQASPTPAVQEFARQTPTLTPQIAQASPVYVNQQPLGVERRDRTVSQVSEGNVGGQGPYEPGDIGRTKDNGYYELTLENAKVSFASRNCSGGFVDVSSGEKMVAVTFSIRAFSLQVPSISFGQENHAYYILDPQHRRFEMSCGDGRYFNVSLNSFEGKPKAKTLTVEFVVPRNAQQLKFRFSPGVGNPIVFDLPNPI